MKKNLKRAAAALLALMVLMSGTALAEPAEDDVDSAAPVVFEAFLDIDLDSQQISSEKAAALLEQTDLPSSVDLRDRGVVPPVRDQNPWGTCWCFGSLAACEISILSDLGMTCQEFKDTYGYDLDLSERHLAWYATGHLPQSSEMDPDSMESAQAGEGQYNVMDETNPNAAHLSVGGFPQIVSSVFSAGIGPVLESEVPYTAANGSSDTSADWSVPEETRFWTAFDLLDSNILPATVTTDATGNCTYSQAAMAAIKQEIVEGHAVSVVYHGDVSSPEDLLLLQEGGNGDPVENIRNKFLELGYPEEDIDKVLTCAENMSVEGLSEEEGMRLSAMVLELLALNMDEESAEQMQDALESGAMDAEMVIVGVLGTALQTIRDSDDKVQYINYQTNAQYTYDAGVEADHCVCIIGYDDNYSAENFLEGHQPPADGAWICRNSWGETWGEGGYFYLSYYDKSIGTAESFEFDVSDLDSRTDSEQIMSYDFMQIRNVNAVYPAEEVKTASIFTADIDAVLSHVSVFTAAPETEVTMSVYLLNNGAADADDGTLLDTQTLRYDWAGYHRVSLNGNFLIPEGSRLSLVVSQTCEKDGETVSVIPVNLGITKEGMEASVGELTVSTPWSVAVVNAGESYVLDSGSWVDWRTVIDELKEFNGFFDTLSIDNPSLKLYLSPFDELQEIHQLDQVETDENGNQVSVCQEDGYTVIR